MRRLPYCLLTLTIIGALAIAYSPWACGPADTGSTPAIQTTDGPPPETSTLRLLAKRHIACDVLDGRLSLFEAASLFRVLNTFMEPAALARDVGHFWALSEPVHTEEERTCRQVVQWVDARRASESPQRVAAAVARLTAEYREEVLRHGNVRLPDRAGLPTAEELLGRARARMTQSERNMLFGGRALTSTDKVR
jgi:hypothetical protein